MELLNGIPRFVFFTGKGGVGKTSLACALAVRLADAGKRVLLVSTDPASNVGQVFGQVIGDRITPVSSVARLDALEIDPEQAAASYRERTLAPVRAFLSAADLAAVTEQLSGSCTTEIASFNEFTALLADNSTSEYDHVVFDTAPTGHTVRLLQLPGEWTQFLDDGLGDASCLGPMSGLEKTRATYAAALAALGDPERTRLVLVARPQASSLAEAARTSSELITSGIRATHLVINGVMPEEPLPDPLADSVRRRESEALHVLPPELNPLRLDRVPLADHNMVGVVALRNLLTPTPQLAADASHGPGVPSATIADLATLVDQLAHQDHGLVMCMGKGGVGKTTIAAALATALADLDKSVHLTTTDPAAHLADTLGSDAGTITVSRIDPDQATQDYRNHVMATKGARLDDAGRAALAEDLRSPCTEEVAVFQAFSRAVSEAGRRFVVMDTAPTGHTLLLMDATGSYHREIARNMAPGMHFTTPMMRLQDPDYTKVILVTLPETTPVLEAKQLQDDLERADIHPWAWVVNQTLTGTDTRSPLLVARAHNETNELANVLELTPRVALVPLEPDAPVGHEHLLSLTRPLAHV